MALYPIWLYSYLWGSLEAAILEPSSSSFVAGLAKLITKILRN